MEKASNLNLAASKSLAAFTQIPTLAVESGFVAITKPNLLKIKGGGGPGTNTNMGDKRRRRTGG